MRSKLFRVRVLGFLVGGMAGMLAAASLPEVPEAALEALGSTPGTPQNGGFVFVDGRYLPPPYTVTRHGNGIFINRIQVEQPVPWSRFEPQPQKAALDDEGDFEDVGDDAEPPPPKRDQVEPPKPAAPDGENNDFEDDVDVVPRRATPKRQEQDDDDTRVTTAAADGVMERSDADLDELFGEEEPAPPKKPAAQPARPGGGPVKTPDAPQAEPPVPKRDLSKEKQMLKAYLDKSRRSYELGLARNEIYFFGSSHNRINGNYGSARAMMEVLPDALRVSTSPEDLLERLRRSGVYFLDIRVVRLIYQNKASYPQLKERLKKIKTAEAAEAERRKRLKRAGPAY